ncbi:MAG: glycosyltransferase family 4 protein [Gemmatimonadales bacterium]
MARGLAQLGSDVRQLEKGKGTTTDFVMRCFAAIVRDRPDHIISTHVNFGPAAHLANRFFKIPYTLVAHGIDIHERLPGRTLAAIRAAERIVAVSEWTRGNLIALGGIDPKRVAILPNTFDEERFTVGEKSPELLSRYKIAPDERVVLTVARLDANERYKGYDRIVEALPQIVRECANVRFLIVGSGADSERVARLARDNGVESSVTFTGFVAQEELADHYRLADVFAMPSTGEGFGIVFLEAMASGTPVVAGNRDGSVDALDKGRLGSLVDPMNVDEIANAITRILARKGPALWFDPHALHDAVVDTFGRRAFVRAMRNALTFN